MTASIQVSPWVYAAWQAANPMALTLLIPQHRAVSANFCRRSGVGNDDVGSLQAGQVKGLAGSGADNGALPPGRIRLGKGIVADAGVDQILVDFIGNHQHVIGPADFRHLLNSAGLHTLPTGLWGLQSRKSLTPVAGNLLLKIPKIYFVFTVDQHQRVLDQLAPVAGNGVGKGRVFRRLNHYGIPPAG